MRNRPVLKLTFDTNCINLRQAVRALNELERLAEEGLIEIAAGPAMLADLQRDKSLHAEDRSEKARLLHERIHTESVEPMPSGSLEAALEATFEREDVKRGLLDLWQTLFPGPGHPTDNQVDDILHILIHRVWKRDIFVTQDTDFLNNREKLKDLVGVTICTPEEALQRVSDHISWAS